MARLSVVGTPFEKALLNDIVKGQSLREHTINPPGQERYIRPIDVEAVQAVLDAHNSGAGTTEDASEVVASTIGIGFVSTTAIQAAVTEVLTANELIAIQDLLSYRVVETGNFLLSFNNGVIKGMLDKGWIKVFNDDGSALFNKPPESSILEDELDILL